MPKHEFAIEVGGPKRIAVSWRGLWKDIEIAFDGKLIGRIESKKELKKGAAFALPDGSELSVKLTTVEIKEELHVLRNGAPLPGSVSDPAQRVKGALGVLYFVAGANIVVGLVAWLGNIEVLQEYGLGFGSIVIGAVYAALAFVVKSKQSRVALVVAMLLFALDAVLAVFTGIEAGRTPPVGGLVARIFLLFPMWNGLGALKELSRAKTEAIIAART